MKHAFLAGLLGLTFLAAPQVGTAFCSAVKNPARPLLEQPAPLKRVPERIIRHTGYLLSFNSETLCPNWSAWELTAAETEGNERRYTDFQPDPQLPISQQVTTYDYKGSGYDRGHMCPSADMKWSPAAQRDCFYMSNICPQDRSLNSGAWSKLENACRRWAKSEGKIYIVCGPVFDKQRKHLTIGRDLRVRVPNGFFKVVLSTRKGHEKAIGFYYSNRDNHQTMNAAAMSVDQVERLTGMDFFPQLNDVLEKRLEAYFDLREWR